VKGDVQVDVGGVTIPVIVDSGALVNIVDRHMWEHMKKLKVECVSRLTNKKVYAYGHEKPLTRSPPNKFSSATFLVCCNFQSASMLLKIGENIVRVSNSLDLDEMPSYSAPHPDASCLHMAL